jgi:ribonuclease HI
MALQWFLERKEIAEGFIFTDSLSSVKLIGNSYVKNQSINIHQIQSYMNEIKDENRIISLGWIPSHRGIPGNEAADATAREATRSQIITIPNYNRLDGKQLIKRRIKLLWNDYWEHKVNSSNTGQHLRTIRTIVGHWTCSCIPSDRRMETSIARLRIGHSGLRAHAFRMGFVWSPLCDCGVPETVQHFLVDCAIHAQHRQHICECMRNLNSPVTVKNILGGGDFDQTTQKHIIGLVGKYILDTGKAQSL